MFGAVLLLRDRAKYEKTLAKANALAAHRAQDEEGVYRPGASAAGPTASQISETRLKYDLTAHGFLPARAIKPLADPRFAAWEALAKALPTHAAAGTFHAAVGQLPLLDATVLTEVEELRRAYLVLGHFVRGG